MVLEKEGPYDKTLTEVIQLHLPVDLITWFFYIICLILTIPLVIAGAVMFGYWDRGSVVSTVGIALFIVGIILGGCVIFIGFLFGVYIYTKRKGPD